MSPTNAGLGIAVVNTRPLQAATLGIAGNWGSTLRDQPGPLIERSRPVGSNHLGDRVGAIVLVPLAGLGISQQLASLRRSLDQRRALAADRRATGARLADFPEGVAAQWPGQATPTAPRR